MSDYRDHYGHEVKFETYEGGMWRLFCLTCGLLLDFFTFIPKTIGKFLLKEKET